MYGIDRWLAANRKVDERKPTSREGVIIQRRHSQLPADEQCAYLIGKELQQPLSEL